VLQCVAVCCSYVSCQYVKSSDHRPGMALFEAPSLLVWCVAVCSLQCVVAMCRFKMWKALTTALSQPSLRRPRSWFSALLCVGLCVMCCVAVCRSVLQCCSMCQVKMSKVVSTTLSRSSLKVPRSLFNLLCCAVLSTKFKRDNFSLMVCNIFFLVTSPFWEGSLGNYGCTLRTPEERLPSGAPKEEFGRMILQKKSSLRDRTNVPRQLLVVLRRGTGTCDAPCILDHHCSSDSL